MVTRRIVLVSLALAGAALGLPSAASGTNSAADPAAALAQVRAQKAALVAQLDLLHANEAQVKQALADLQANVSAQEALVATAERAASAAAARVDQLTAKETDIKARLASTRTALSKVVVDAYVRPASSDAVMLFGPSGTTQVVRDALTRVRVGQMATLLDQLAADREDLKATQAAAKDASTRADAAAGAANARLVDLNQALTEQDAFAARIEDQLDDSLSEAAGLAALDQQLSEQLAARQAFLAQQARLAQEAAAKAAAQRAAAKAAAEKAEAERKKREQEQSTTTTTRKPTTSTTQPRSGGGSTTTTAPGGSGGSGGSGGGGGGETVPPGMSPSPGGPIKVVSVRGIYVNAVIASKVEAMLAAAQSAGYVLGGGGYRDPSAQIAMRTANCGPTHYDIWDKPPSACTPPTARPGHSQHEYGLAIDFTYQGAVIVSHSNPAWVWLSQHAASYGFYNLASEPWHWSTTGS